MAGQTGTRPHGEAMSIMLVAVIGASIAFMLCFLFAIRHEQRIATNRTKVVLLNGATASESGKIRASSQVKLRAVPPQIFQDRKARLVTGMKIVPRERLG